MVQPANKRLVTEAALPEAVRAVLEASFVAGTGVTITHDGEANTVTIAATGGGGGLDLEAVQDAIAAAIVPGDNLSSVYDDTAGTITLTLAEGLEPEVLEYSMRAFRPDPNRLSLSPEQCTISLAVGADGTFNRQYVRGSTASPPADWPVDYGWAEPFVSGPNEFQGSPTTYGLALRRIMTDADEIVFAHTPTVSATSGPGIQVYVDGRPVTAEPIRFTVSGLTYTKIVFPGAKVRLIEWMLETGCSAVFCKKPYTIWKPPPVDGPHIYVIGDSMTTPTVYSDSGATTNNPFAYGAYQGIAPYLGLAHINVDGVGGSGFLRASSQANYRDRMNLKLVDPIYGMNTKFPEFIVWHGGGANDLFHGHTVPDIKAQISGAFDDAKALRADVKNVFIEGMALGPSGGVGFSGFADEYADIRDYVVSNEPDAYVIGTAGWYAGMGNVNAPNADAENHNLYLGGDAVHFSIAGNLNFRQRLATKLRRVLADTTGDLRGQVI